MTVGSLFAGIGGFDLGFERAGFETVWQVEINEYCRKVLERHFPDAERFEDIRACGREAYPHKLKPVDVICGGFPCQDISIAGRGAGIFGERSGLWREMERIISGLRPRYVVVENVSALLGRGFGRVLGDLSEIGYDAEWKVISSAEVGAPHRRDRVWIVAYPSREGLSGCHEGPRIFGSAETTLPKHGDDTFGSWGDLPSAIQRIPTSDGLSVGMVRRLIQPYGNAVVPQIPEWIARQILKAEVA